MNTPKLNNALVSAVTRSSTVRSELAPGTSAADFSQLLGAKREQISTSAALQNARRPETTTSGRAPVADVGAKSDAPVRSSENRQVEDTNDRPSRQSDSARDAAPANERTRSTAAGNGDAVQVRESARDGSEAPAVERPEQSAENANAIAETPVHTDAVAAQAQTPAQLQQAAQSGTILAAAMHTALQATASEEAGIVVPAALAGAGSTGTHAAAQSAPAPAALANPLGLPAMAAAADPALTAAPLDAAGVPVAAQTAVGNQALAATTAAAQAPASAPGWKLPELAIAPAGNAAAATPVQDIQAVTVQQPAAQAQPLVAATGAAALSLQDFTAMVQAARATSGTSLQNSATGGIAAAATTPGAGLSGVPFGALIPGQPLAAGTPVSGSIPAPLASPQWPTELGRQFISIAQAGNSLGQIAELRLDPPELGPLRITINLNDNVAHAVFSSPHASVRQTVENALPQLQQMLEQAGISLGQANVNDQQAGRESQDRNGAQGGQGHASGLAVEESGEGSIATARASRTVDPDALVDTFA